MKLILPLLFLSFAQLSFSQSVDLATERSIISETLCQYLNTNPNSAASFLKTNKGYQLMRESFKMALAFEPDSVKQKGIYKEMANFEHYVDSITTQLQNKKIIVQLADTLYTYQYVARSRNLKTEKDWQNNYANLLDDFQKNNLHRFDTIIGESYIGLIKQQINYKGESIPLELSSFNLAHYQYQKKAADCEQNEFCIQADKVYRAVFNAEGSKGCYLFSFLCGENKICRSFIFIKKENGRWVYVAQYPSWIIDEA
ncbi:hypothetical protein U0035_22325 [Niabella yanshanensis]|uniref:Uncharacterized protein n=1 Tax=Niabella yanshanensis TaxID=577386 RepID=A0ABZ0W7A1_9BACT|nr:hypothetical protein [Niabella yanshanensis]WQD38414.1 hypothetical protein U0035_22325 [Niabella yanshanensis]